MMENSSMKLKNDHKNMSISVVDKYLRSINDKMRSDSHDLKDVRLSVNLLDRFVQGESLNVVVLTLYSPSEGYTLALKIHDALENETSLIPYHEDELLNCIDNQQLPPVLVELLEEVGAQVFYDGCVFVEVRDCRENSKLSWHVLLKPSSQSVMADAQQICQEHGWGSEELLQLESVLCMAVAEPLCLSPNPALGDLAINRDRVAKQMQSTALQRTRRNLIANGTKRKPEPTNASEFRLYEFLRKKSRLGRTIPPILKVRDDTRNSSSPPPQLDVADVLRLAKPLERAKETTDCSTVTCEEYMYETDRVNGRVNLVRLTILQRPATEEFLGQLYVDRDFREGTVGTVNGAGASCMFSLGTRLNVNRYIQQFTEIFTEEGRKSVKITHQVQNQPPRVMYTQSMREKERLREKEAAALQLQQQQQTQQQQANEAAPPAAEVEPSAPLVVPVVTEPVAPVTAPLTKTALIESLKSGQVTPAIATLVSNLLSSAQQTQIRSQSATGVHLLTNGQQQSLLRPSAASVGVRAATGSVQNIQLITQALPVHQGQAQLRPNIRPTALAALLTTKAAAATPAAPAGKGKVIPGTGAQGQVIRPATASPASVTTPILPSYSQAISQTTGGGTIVRAIRPSIGTAAAGTVVGTIRRPSDGLASTNGPTVGQRFSLTTLLAGTPSADSPNSNGSNSVASGSNNGGSAVSLPSLLERLQQQQSPGKLQPTAGPVTLNNNAPTAKLMVNSVNSNHNNNLNVQSINLAGLQGAVASLPLQSIQVSIPGIATPFSLSVAVTSSSTQASTVSTPSVMGSVRLATAVNATSGTPISIPLSVLQIPSSGGPVQLIGSMAKGGVAGTGAGGAAGSAAAVQRTHATNNSANNAQMASTAANPSSGSLLAQQQLQLALQRQASVQIQLQQKMAAKQQQQPKPKPQHNS